MNDRQLIDNIIMHIIYHDIWSRVGDLEQSCYMFWISQYYRKWSMYSLFILRTITIRVWDYRYFLLFKVIFGEKKTETTVISRFSIMIPHISLLHEILHPGKLLQYTRSILNEVPIWRCLQDVQILVVQKCMSTQ